MKPTFILGGLVILVVLLLSWNRFFGAGSGTAIITDPNNLPGIETGAAPWPAETVRLRERLAALGVPALGAEGSALHTHQHLDLVINGAPVAVPADIGVNEAAGFISPIHTHEANGVIHIESNIVRDFTLGQFFDVWGVRFTRDCIGGYCANATSTLKAYVNGSLVPGDPRALVLAARQEITVVYGTAQEAPATIPSSYSFPLGD